MKANQMNWGNITNKLMVGVSLADRQAKAEGMRSATKILKRSLKSTGQLGGPFEGLGDAGIVEQLQSGGLIPDELFGWSTKTILALLLGLMLFKVKKLQGA